MKFPIRSYTVTLDGGLLGLERLIGLLRRRRIAVVSLGIDSEAPAGPTRATIRIASPNHDQVARQLGRLVDVIDHLSMDDNDNDAG